MTGWQWFGFVLATCVLILIFFPKCKYHKEMQKKTYIGMKMHTMGLPGSFSNAVLDWQTDDLHCSTIVWSHPTSASIFLAMESYVNFIRVPPAIFKRPPTPLQNFTIHHRFGSAPVLRSAGFSSWSKKQCVAFVSKTFSCVLSLCVNFNFKTKWQSCQPISLLEFLNSLFSCLVVGFLRWWHLQSPPSCSGDRKNYPKAT